MKHVIIGTAGHVDHGKTKLVEALTGTDTDRLAEEKRRGLTIELGFARIAWPDGTSAGVIDVPGHESFLKNMLAGAGGIDLAMLVIAADEGVMPQTVEHLRILSLLGVENGLIVLTKCDLVSAEWLEMVRGEAAALAEGTFLEGKPLAEVSVVTGEGIAALRALLYDMVQSTREKNLHAPFRLPVDRVFSADGFGTVVTGTLLEGRLHGAEEVELAPGGMRARVRNLQVHGENVETAYAGERVAVNLAGVKKEEVRRGDAVVRPGSIRISRMLDVRLQCLPGVEHSIKNQTQVHLYHGARALLARVVLLDREELRQGESGYAQLRLTEDVAAKKGDRFVVRFYSPLETIGGGVILDEAPLRHKRGEERTLAALAVLERGDREARVLYALEALDGVSASAVQVAAQLNGDTEAVQAAIGLLAAQGRVCETEEGRYVAASALDRAWERCRTALAAYHRKNPLHAGMRASELHQKSFSGTKKADADALLRLMEEEGRLRRIGERYALDGFVIRETKRQAAVREKIRRSAEQAGFVPHTKGTLRVLLDRREAAELDAVLESMLTEGALVEIGQGRYVHRNLYQKACRAAGDWFAAQETLTLAQLRDLLGISRDQALLYLEYFDRRRMTRRRGDVRFLDRGFPQ